MAKEDMSKMAFRCPHFIGLFEWVVMTLGLKNASATYQMAMNLIFHELLGIILEVYIDDVVVKSDRMDGHLADLCLPLERMHRYGLKMNPLKCGPIQQSREGAASLSPTDRTYNSFVGCICRSSQRSSHHQLE
jgi:hypothetical protein